MRTESNTPVGYRMCLLDSANPAFYVRDYSERGQALNADYRIKPTETANEYWVRVGIEIRANK